MRRKEHFLAILLATALLGGCDREIASYRYKVRVEVQTPNGPKTGEGVFAVRYYAPRFTLDGTAGHMQTQLSGEAIPIVLSKDRVILLVTNRVSGLYSGPPRDSRDLDSDSFRYWNRKLHKDIDRHVKKDDLYGGMYIVLNDLNNPTLAKEIRHEDFKRFLGNDYGYPQIRVEITDDDVTQSLSKSGRLLERYPTGRVCINQSGELYTAHAGCFPTYYLRSQYKS